MTTAFWAWSSVVRPILPFAHVTALVCRAPDRAGAVGEPQIGDVQRVFSTIPAAYPVGGWKHLTGSDWARYVLIDQRTLIASGHERLTQFFPDYPLLESLGVRTLINIPVVICRRTVGAFALLLETPTVDQAALAEVEAIAPLMSGVFALGQGTST
ncbi:GAF domain-containing protein [Pandoraea captiosa]|uniref:GAF domain-containing protein n=1 Tax=Pandoraea captiosa TaxID=2508302 RepID=UPI001241DE6F|nr:GAF domain-containing protein [Pandoraea captiosa]